MGKLTDDELKAAIEFSKKTPFTKEFWDKVIKQIDEQNIEAQKFEEKIRPTKEMMEREFNF